MYTYSWYHWLTFFYIYCLIGWMFESCYVSIKSHQWINRGFLRLPMLPIYGTGAVLMLWVALPLLDHPILLYFAGVTSTTILEYITGYTMEFLFKVKYWDYSNQKFNLHGYICLSSSISWGFFTMLMVHIIHQPIANSVLRLPFPLEVLTIIVISILFITDLIESTIAALDLGRLLESMTNIRAEIEHTQVQLSLLKAETSQRVDQLKEGAIHLFAEIKEEWREDKEGREKRLAETVKNLSEKQNKLVTHINPHIKKIRRRMLFGNPSASSKRFSKALRDLKDLLK